MKTDDELFALISKYLDTGCERLWDALTPEERRKVFSELIIEHIESTW